MQKHSAYLLSVSCCKCNFLYRAPVNQGGEENAATTAHNNREQWTSTPQPAYTTAGFQLETFSTQLSYGLLWEIIPEQHPLKFTMTSLLQVEEFTSLKYFTHKLIPNWTVTS